MQAHRSRRAIAASVVLMLLAAACSAAPSPSSSAAPASIGPTPVPTPRTLTDYPTGFSTIFVVVPDEGGPGLVPVPDGLEGHETGTLHGTEGTSATYTSTWVENRAPAATVTCLGVTYTDLFIGATPEVTTEIDFGELGHATLVTVGHVVVYRSSRNGSSPAICDEVTGGTFEIEFTGGPVKQLMSGTWHREEGGRLVFDSTATPLPSPSESPG